MKKILNQWKNMPASAKSSIAFVTSTFIVKGISFITTPIFTRIMETGQYGLNATYSSWQSIIEVFALLGLTSAGVFNVGLNDYRDKRDQYMSLILILCNITTLCVFAVIFAIKHTVDASFIMNESFLVLMFVHMFFNPALIFWITRQRYEYKYKAATAVSILSAVSGQLLSIIFVMGNYGQAGLSKLWGAEIGSLVFTIPIYLMILIKGKAYFNIRICIGVLSFALPLIPHYLAQHIMGSVDRIMLSDMVGNEEAGIYSVVASISMISSIFWNAINASLVPYTFERINNKKYKDIDNVVGKLLVFYGVICTGITLFAPELLGILAPSEYARGLYAIPPIAVMAYTCALYNIFANMEFYYKKSKTIASATIIASIVNVVLNYIFIPKYGMIAASYTTLISYVLLIFLHYRGYKKCPDAKIYSITKILSISILTIGCCLLCNILYIRNFVRYIVIALLLIMIGIFRNRIIKIVKELKM